MGGKRLNADRRAEAGGDKGEKVDRQLKVREGANVGCKVTLRGERMYEFLR